MSFSQLLSDFGVSFQKEVVEQKNFGFLDLKFDRHKKRQETDSSGKKHFLPEYLILSDYFETSQKQNLVFFLRKKIVKHALRIFIGWNLQPSMMNFRRKKM